MRKSLCFTTNNNGFILVHVLFVVSLLFILVSHGISSYHSEIYISNIQQEQIQVESIFQMAKESYKRDHEISEDFIENITYEFPQGVAEINILVKEIEYLKLVFKITLHKSPSNYYLQNHLFVYN